MRRSFFILILLTGCDSLPGSLFDTGLYQSNHSTLAEGVLEYTPRISFWSDGAQKTRWVLIPEGEKITGEWPLSLSALQLDHDASGLTLKDLDEKGFLSEDAPAEPLNFPGSETEKAALACLHVNCGNCHHEKVEPPPPDGFGPPDDLQLKVLVSELAGLASETSVHKTTVGVEATSDNDVEGLTLRVVVGSAEESVLFRRMAARDGDEEPSVQMPRAFGGSEVDEDGLALLRTFIDGL
jgi:hypothetical protein